MAEEVADKDTGCYGMEEVDQKAEGVSRTVEEDQKVEAVFRIQVAAEADRIPQSLAEEEVDSM